MFFYATLRHVSTSGQLRSRATGPGVVIGRAKNSTSTATSTRNSQRRNKNSKNISKKPKPLQLGCLRPALPRAQYDFHRTCETFFSFEKRILSHRFAILQIEIIITRHFCRLPRCAWRRCRLPKPDSKTWRREEAYHYNISIFSNYHIIIILHHRIIRLLLIIFQNNFKDLFHTALCHLVNIGSIVSKSRNLLLIKTYVI